MGSLPRNSITKPAQSEKGQLRALTVGRQKTRLRGSRHTNPRYPTRPKDIHLENLENPRRVRAATVAATVGGNADVATMLRKGQSKRGHALVGFHAAAASPAPQPMKKLRAGSSHVDPPLRIGQSASPAVQSGTHAAPTTAASGRARPNALAAPQRRPFTSPPRRPFTSVSIEKDVMSTCVIPRPSIQPRECNSSFDRSQLADVLLSIRV